MLFFDYYTMHRIINLPNVHTATNQFIHCQHKPASRSLNHIGTSAQIYFEYNFNLIVCLLQFFKCPVKKINFTYKLTDTVIQMYNNI